MKKNQVAIHTKMAADAGDFTDETQKQATAHTMIDQDSGNSGAVGTL